MRLIGKIEHLNSLGKACRFNLIYAKLSSVVCLIDVFSHDSRADWLQFVQSHNGGTVFGFAAFFGQYRSAPGVNDS